LTKGWFLVEEANRNMNIAMICADGMYAINQLSEKPKWNSKKIELSITNAKNFLEEFSIAVESMYKNDVVSDPFMFSLADLTAKFMLLRPKQLHSLSKTAINELANRRLSDEAYELLSSIVKITQQAAVQKCETVKPMIP
jgi:hypothetical protein